ncbi:MAG: hypothetical protein M1825_003660 [Sarcosagium campestre]|nr:MAG: hypothetical protein M1825_003660 [Sarcosagium campestre]
MSSVPAPLKSILKPSKATVHSSIDAPIRPRPASPTSRHRAIALDHARDIQFRKDVETLIFDSICTLLSYPPHDPPTPGDVQEVEKQLALFTRTDYDALVEERNIDGRCGYALCSRPRQLQNTTARFRILGKTGKGEKLHVVPTKAMERWCSDDCARRMAYLRVQLAEEPAWARAEDAQPKLHIMNEERKVNQKVMPQSLEEAPAGADKPALESKLEQPQEQRQEQIGQPEQAKEPSEMQSSERSLGQLQVQPKVRSQNQPKDQPRDQAQDQENAENPKHQKNHTPTPPKKLQSLQKAQQLHDLALERGSGPTTSNTSSSSFLSSSSIPKVDISIHEVDLDSSNPQERKVSFLPSRPSPKTRTTNGTAASRDAGDIEGYTPGLGTQRRGHRLITAASRTAASTAASTATPAATSTAAPAADEDVQRREKNDGDEDGDEEGDDTDWNLA